MVNKMNDVRLLKADEIECRVGMIRASADKKYGCSLLLYKDARVDMRILDETVGVGNWTRAHHMIGENLYCSVGIYSKELGMWIHKEDVGVESKTEKEKGQASDAFKRACFNWGIGRELYTAPFVWVSLYDAELYGSNQVRTKFYVREIGYDDKRNINHLVIVDGDGNARYNFDKRGGAR